MNNKFHDVRIQARLTLTELSGLFNIPYRTVQNWDAGIRKPPEYVVEMMVYILKHEGRI